MRAVRMSQTSKVAGCKNLCSGELLRFVKTSDSFHMSCDSLLKWNCTWLSAATRGQQRELATSRSNRWITAGYSWFTSATSLYPLQAMKTSIRLRAVGSYINTHYSASFRKVLVLPHQGDLIIFLFVYFFEKCSPVHSRQLYLQYTFQSEGKFKVINSLTMIHLVWCSQCNHWHLAIWVI